MSYISNPGAGTAAAIAVGSTSITGGTPGRVLFDSAGKVGENSGITFSGSTPTITASTLSGTTTAPDGSLWTATNLSLSPAGSLSNPTLVFSNAGSNTGIVAPGANQLEISVGGVLKLDYNVSVANQWQFSTVVQFNSQNISSVLALIFSGGARVSGTGDGRTVIVSGIDQAAPVAGNLKFPSVASGTTNTSGQNSTIVGSLSTGSGTSGDVSIQTGGTGAGSTAQNSPVSGLTVKGATQAVITSSSVGDAGYGYATPSTGGTVTLASNVYHQIIDPAGTLATLTINMTPSPFDGQFVDIKISQVVTALTVSGNGNSIAGNPTSAAVGSSFTGIFRLANTTWYF